MISIYFICLNADFQTDSVSFIVKPLYQCLGSVLLTVWYIYFTFLLCCSILLEVLATRCLELLSMRFNVYRRMHGWTGFLTYRPVH